MIHREGGLANPRLVAIFKVESKELELVTKRALQLFIKVETMTVSTQIE